jgi:hypothetical protein
LSSWREEIEAQVGNANVVALFDNQLTMSIVSANRAGEGKSKQQSKEAEDRTFHHSTLRQVLVMNAETAARFEQNKH